MKSSDSVKTYLNEIRSVPLLTKDEEIELARCLEDCRAAIVRKLLDTGALTEEINELKGLLMEAEEGKEDTTHDDSGILPEEEDIDAGKDILNITDEINNISLPASISSSSGRIPE